MRDEDKPKEQLNGELQEMRQKASDWALGKIADFVREKLLRELVSRSEADPCSVPSRLLSVQEQERKRIARELHDSLGSLLTAIKINLENARSRITMGETDPAFLDNPINLIQLAIQEVRTLIMDLRPSLLDDLGLIAAMNWLCRQMADCSNITIEKTIGVEESQIPERLKIVIFRVLQEAFQNIAKYSKTNLVELAFITNENALELTLKDHGVGFDINHALAKSDDEKGLGLTTMKERTEFSGGSFSIISLSGEGTTIQASWPEVLIAEDSETLTKPLEKKSPRVQHR